MDRLDDHVWRRGQETIDKMRTGDRLRFRSAVPVKSCPDAGKAKQRPALVAREPDDVLVFGLGVRLRRILGKAIGRHQAAVFGLEPGAPMRRGGIADVGHRRPAGPRRRWYAPAHEDQLFGVAGVADHRCRIVGEYARHRREIADVAV